MENTCDRTCMRPHNSKNTCVVCHMSMPLYGVLPHLFLIHSFSALLVTQFLSSNALSTYIKLFIYFPSFMKVLLVFPAPVTVEIHLHAVRSIVVMKLFTSFYFVCICNKKRSRQSDFVY